ncbi:DUF1772 domain-containing protein [Streptomyces sp. NPDC060194]|uniref:anthrone oxygenase family protein n=1 Tax=Streptomyces sp. NPDC060194 TaxID=3347069 RepID=UPI003667F6E4
MRRPRSAALLAATLCTGLRAGLLAGFAYAVMPGLAGTSDRTFVEAMQGVNAAIVNPVFMVPFLGAVPLLGRAAVLARRGPDRAALPSLVAALALYGAAFAVTGGFNVPLNDALAAAGDPDRFEGGWVFWNAVRALLHTGAFACTARALMLHRTYQSHEVPDKGPRSEPTPVRGA